MATVQVRRKGMITLPGELRRKYHVDEGDIFTLIDVGNGSFLLTPHVSPLASSGDRAAKVIAAVGVSLEDLLQVLHEEREAYYRDHYHVHDAHPAPEAPA